jgi:prolipoprotein diacylglyceryltransferase
MLRSFFEKLNQNPLLYAGNNFYIVKFGLYAGVGALVGASCAVYYAKLAGIEMSLAKDFWLVVLMLFILLGSKLLHFIVCFKEFRQNPWQAIRSTAFYDQGGQIGAAFGLIIYSYLSSQSFFIFADAITYGGTIALAIGRLGCYNYGCCFGRPTNSRFGIAYHHPASKVLRLYPNLKGVKLFPTQLLTALFNFCLFIIFNIMLLFDIKVGMIMTTYLICFNLVRMIIHFYRYNDTKAHAKTQKDENIYFLIALSFFSLGVGILIYSLLPGNALPDLTYIAPHSLYSFYSLVINEPIFWWMAFIALLFFLSMGIHYKKIGHHY